MASLRVAQMSRLFTDRYGEILPDDDAGRDDAMLISHPLAELSGDPRKRIMGFIELRCPWMPIAEAKALMIETLANPRRWRADKLGWRLRLTTEERTRLKITTIGAIDKPKSARYRERQERKRARKAMMRRKAGAKPRAQYLATSISRAKPWAELGMSRAAWYRAGKPVRQPETSPAPAYS